MTSKDEKTEKIQKSKVRPTVEESRDSWSGNRWPGAGIIGHNDDSTKTVFDEALPPNCV